MLNRYQAANAHKLQQEQQASIESKRREDQKREWYKKLREKAKLQQAARTKKPTKTKRKTPKNISHSLHSPASSNTSTEKRKKKKNRKKTKKRSKKKFSKSAKMHSNSSSTNSIIINPMINNINSTTIDIHVQITSPALNKNSDSNKSILQVFHNVNITEDDDDHKYSIPENTIHIPMKRRKLTSPTNKQTNKPTNTPTIYKDLEN